MARRAFGSMRQLASGRWQARYTGLDLAEHKAPTTFRTKREAEAWLGAEDRLVSSGTWTPPARRLAASLAAPAVNGLTVGEYIERVIVRRANRSRKPLAPTTVDLYRKDARLELASPFSAVLLVALTPTMVSTWCEQPTVSPTQKGRAYDLLKSVLTDAVEEELIERNPCRVKGAGKPAPKHQGVALSAVEVLRYLEAVPERYRVPLMTSAWCGLRSGEVRGLRRRDVDLANGKLTIEQAVSRQKTGDHSYTWRIAGPKTISGFRTVRMPSMMIEPMRAWLSKLPMAGADGLLFPGDSGPRKPIHSSVLYKAHAKGKGAVGHPSLTVHDLRRTAATLAAQGGATTAELMRLLGHTTPAMAMKYQVATDERDRERAARLDAVIAAAHAG